MLPKPSIYKSIHNFYESWDSDYVSDFYCFKLYDLDYKDFHFKIENGWYESRDLNGYTLRFDVPKNKS